MRKIAYVLLCILLLSACSSSKDTAMPYDLGMRYLENGEYDEAVLAFQAVIKIDPKNAAAYIGMADAYVQAGDLEKAIQILQDAQDIVSDPDSIQKKLDELEKMKDPDAEYYRFIHDSLLPEFGYADDQQKSLQVTNNENPVEHYGWDRRDGLLGADISDLNADGIDDLIVYRFDYEVDTQIPMNEILLVSQVYIKNKNGEFSSAGTAVLGSTNGCEAFNCSASLLKRESRTSLYVEDNYSGIFNGYGGRSYDVFELSENGKWYRRYSISNSRGGPIGMGYSLWTYEDDGSSEETLLYYEGDDEEALTPPGTDLDDALSLGFEMMGIQKADYPPSVTFEVTDNYGDNATTIISSPTDYTQFKEKINQYSS